MKPFNFILFLVFFSQNSFANSSLKTIIDHYFKVNTEEISLNKFEEILDKTEANSIEIEGYKSMLWFLKAKDYFNPINKLEAFNKGKKLLEELLVSYPNNFELHFLRLTIQDHSPTFLGYNDKVKQDERFILNQLGKLKDSDLKQRISMYLKGGRI